MNGLDLLAEVSNAGMVIDRFGQWPTFHDSEVISIQLNRAGPFLILELYAFQTTSEKDLRGNFRRKNECQIVFLFDDIEELSLAAFNHQNVLAGLHLSRRNNLIEVSMDSLFGIEGHFVCKRMEVVSVVPVNPKQVG
jgi:hypothetical protein